MNKPKLIVLEGVDKVGKSTIYQALRRATNYGPLVIDRFLASNYAYDSFYGRDHYIEDYQEIELEMLKTFDCYLVWVMCDEDVLHKRLKKYENMKEDSIKNILKVEKHFRDYVCDRTLFKTIFVDTSQAAVEDSCKEIMIMIEHGEG